MAAEESVEGPWIAVAALCEHLIEDKEGRISLIGLTDRIVFSAAGPEPPEKMPATTLQLWVVVSLKSGFARGTYTVSLQMVNPSGVRGPEISGKLLLEGEDRGANFIGQVGATLNEDGLYWFDVRIEGRLKTRIPLRVVYQRLATGSAGTPSPNA